MSDIKRIRWLFSSDSKIAYCSKCVIPIYISRRQTFDYLFCPYCGSKMNSEECDTYKEEKTNLMNRIMIRLVKVKRDLRKLEQDDMLEMNKNKIINDLESIISIVDKER